MMRCAWPQVSSLTLVAGLAHAHSSLSSPSASHFTAMRAATLCASPTLMALASVASPSMSTQPAATPAVPAAPSSRSQSSVPSGHPAMSAFHAVVQASGQDAPDAKKLGVALIVLSDVRQATSAAMPRSGQLALTSSGSAARLRARGSIISTVQQLVTTR